MELTQIPQCTRTQYTSAIHLTATTTLKFIAYDTAGNKGTGEETYTLDTTGPTVTADPTSTPFGPLGLDVELNSDDTDLASIFYTTDGTDPDTSATRTHTQVLYILQQLQHSSSLDMIILITKVLQEKKLTH